MAGKKKDHQLARFIYTLLRCNEMTAFSRVCTLFRFVLTSPMRCLAGKANPKPSELLEALGVRKTDANFGKLFLAEFVPDAA